MVSPRFWLSTLRAVPPDHHPRRRAIGQTHRTGSSHRDWHPPEYEVIETSYNPSLETKMNYMTGKFKTRIILQPVLGFFVGRRGFNKSHQHPHILQKTRHSCMLAPCSLQAVSEERPPDIATSSTISPPIHSLQHIFVMFYKTDKDLYMIDVLCDMPVMPIQQLRVCVYVYMCVYVCVCVICSISACVFCMRIKTSVYMYTSKWYWLYHIYIALIIYIYTI